MKGNDKMKSKKFKSLAGTHFRKIVILLVISTLSVTMLCSCGDSETSNETTESAAQKPTETVEPTETTASTGTTEVTTEASVESIEITDEYCTEYPLKADTQNVYIKLPDGFNFYPNASFYDSTYLDHFNDGNTLTCFMSEADANDVFRSEGSTDACPIYIEYNVVENNADHTLLEWYNKNQSIGYGLGWNNEHFEISDTETFENGITVSKIEYVYSLDNAEADITNGFYVCEYKLNDKYSIVINISQVYSFGGYLKYDHTEIATAIIDFYRNAVSPFVVQ